MGNCECGRDENEQTPAAGKASEKTKDPFLDVTSGDRGVSANADCASAGQDARNRMQELNAALKQRLESPDTDLDMTGPDGSTWLHQTAGRGLVDDTCTLLQKLNNKQVNRKDDGGRTALHRAAENGHFEVVKLLLDKEADVNAMNNHDDTPLHEAAAAGKIDIVKALIAAKAVADISNMKEETPLVRAEKNKDRQMEPFRTVEYAEAIDALRKAQKSAVAAAEGMDVPKVPTLAETRKMCKETWGKGWYNVAEDVQGARKLVAAAVLGGPAADEASITLAGDVAAAREATEQSAVKSACDADSCAAHLAAMQAKGREQEAATMAVVHWKGVTKKQFTPYKEHLLEKYGLGIKTIDKIPNRILISVSNAEVMLKLLADTELDPRPEPYMLRK